MEFANRLSPSAWRRPSRHPVRCLQLVFAIVAVRALSTLVFATTVATASQVTTGFLSAPTDQVAVPGMIAGGEITPEGDLYTGWAEYELRFGRRLAAWDQPTRTLPDPSLPLLSSNLSDGPVHYTQTIFAIAVAGRPVAYETVSAANASNHPREAQLAMAIAYTRGRQIPGVHGLRTGAYRYERPVTGQPDGFYDQPGQSFSPAFTYNVGGRDLDRSGLLLARGPATAGRLLQGSETNSLTSTHVAKLFKVLLKAHGRVSFTWQIPLEPPVAGAEADHSLDQMPLSQARAQLGHIWAAQEAGMTQISVPEAKVANTYRAAITEILSSRYQTPSGWVQGSNKLQYQAFWIRDGVIDTQALDLAGLDAQAEQNLDFQDTYQQPDGLFISRVDQYDGLGQALWALDQHAQLTQSPAYAAAQLPRIQAAIGWLSSATASDPLGLLPSGNPGDDELAYGHITGDDLWAAAGLRSAIATAVLAGRADLASAWQAVDDRFEASLDREITVAVARTGHIPPVLDMRGGQDWGNYYAAYPVEVLPARSAAVLATTAWARAHMIQGLSTYSNGHSLHDYLGFSIYQMELAAGDSKDAIAGLYSELAHTTSTDAGWEWDIAPWGYRGAPTDMSPHGTFAGDYVTLLRNLLVADTPQGGVNLLAGASPSWLAASQHITVVAAPTDHGVISFTERSSTHGETLKWNSSLAPGTPVTWVLPKWARHARISGRAVSGLKIKLAGRSGSLEVSFDGHGPDQSYARAVASLNGAYRAHGQRPPLVPVKH
jgi:hypothetical protein